MFRNLILLKLFFILSFSFFILFSCRKDEYKRIAKIETKDVIELMATTATAQGNIIDLGEGVTDYGHCWALHKYPDLSDSVTSLGKTSKTGVFSSKLKNLRHNNNYNIRAYVLSAKEVYYGEELNFYTESGVASIITSSVIYMTESSVQCGGEITNDGGAEITARGVCWNTIGNPTINDNKTNNGSGNGIYISYVTGLDNTKTYYFRAYATNIIGTTYGAQGIFKATDYLPDIDGNIYRVIKIGGQTWMKENLKTTKYNDGTGIQLITDNSLWLNNPNTPAYCWYNNDKNNKNAYGALYNGNAVKTNKLCPTGWHIPTNSEWITLTYYLGGANIAGMKMKETGTAHWVSPNTSATNESGFTALPGGIRYYIGEYSLLGKYAYWWTSTAIGTGFYYDYISYSSSYNSFSTIEIDYGLSIRCIKD